MGHRIKIDREFLRSLSGTGKYQEFTDLELRGFGVKVSPAGTVAYTVRWLKPDGKQGRTVVGYFPAMNPGSARELARAQLALTEKKTDTLAERAERRRHRIETEREVGTGLTLAQFLDADYGEWIKSNRRSGESMVNRLKTVFAEHLDKPLIDFTPWIVEKWRITRRKTCTVGTTNRELNALKAVFAKAVAWEVIPEHPLQKVKIEADQTRVVRFLSDDEEIALRTALDERERRIRNGRASGNAWRAERRHALMPDRSEVFVDHLKSAVLVSLNTGLRRGELLALRWLDIDLDRALLTVRAATAKSEKDRHVPMNREALQTLKAWRKQSTGDFVFAGRGGEPLTDLKTAWLKLLTDAGIERFRWHDQRHHFASRLVMEGVDLNTVRELMGHADLKMTLRYAHLAPEHKAAAVAKLDRVLKPKSTARAA